MRICAPPGALFTDEILDTILDTMQLNEIIVKISF